MSFPADPTFPSFAVDDSASGSNKRPLEADDSFSSSTFGQSTSNGISHPVVVEGMDPEDDMISSMYFGTQSTGMGKSLSGQSAASQQSFLNPNSGNTSDAPRKRIRRGPPAESSPHSHITSPADSDHSSAPNLTSPPDEDGPSNLATATLRNHLSQFQVDSGPSSSASSAYGGEVAAAGWGDTQMSLASGAASPAAAMSRNGSSHAQQLPIMQSSSPPVQQLNRMRRGKPPAVQESPTTPVIDLRSPGSGSPLPNIARQSPTLATGPMNPAFLPSGSSGPPPFLPHAGPVIEPPVGAIPDFDRFFSQCGTAFARASAWVAWNQAERNTMKAMALLVGAPSPSSRGPSYPSPVSGARSVPTPPGSARRPPTVISRPVAPQPPHQVHPGYQQQRQSPLQSGAGQFYGTPHGYPQQRQAPPPTFPSHLRPTVIQNSTTGVLTYLPPGFAFNTTVPAEEGRRQMELAAQHYAASPQGRAFIMEHQKTLPGRSSPALIPRQPVPMQAQSSLHRTVIPSPKKKKRRNLSDSDDDGGGGYSDGSGDEYGGLSPAQIARREAAALAFFNDCTKEELQELGSCNPAQAALVIKLRPFESADDFRSRTRKQKGVGNNMLDNYLEVMAGMNEVDKVLTDCEQIGKELGYIMKIWASGAVEEPVTRPGTPDVGIHLVNIAEDAVFDKAAASEDPRVKKAFEGYLRKQPDAVPDNIVLKDYQMLGLNWLNLLYQRKTSCILADEMGLGKTAQVISLMAHLKSTGEKGPHLVIVPSSTLENWMREFSVFAPSLNAQSYYGSQAERQEIRHELKVMEDLDVIVTTYNIATSSPDDQKFLRKRMDFKICIYDEGHQLKNSESKKYKELMQIKAKWRCLLTGTPLQNNLQELVSLLSFILPDQFREADESLRAIFKVAPGSGVNLLSRERITRAKKMMTPFVLRRKKAQVLKDLPSKTERIEWCEMTDLQQEVYNEAITRSKKALLELADEDLEEIVEEEEEVENGESKPKKAPKQASSTKTGNKSDLTSSSNVLMDLRKASCHPMLFRRLYTDKTLKAMARDCLKELEFTDRNKDLIFEDFQVMTDFEIHRFSLQYKHLQKYALRKDEWMSAGKIQKLQELLPDLKANGDRVLLFSQFTQVLDILEVVLNTMGIKYLKLTGQTNVTERQGLVDEYTDDPDITVFLLSTRAGGLGLNLTAANTVCFYDQDYNPHNDKQAEDRAFRIGQERDVTVIKLITRGSLEEDMRDLATQKLLLDDSVSSNSQYPTGAAAPTTEDEGNSGQVEKKMRTSLLSNLKKRFTAGEPAHASGEGGSSPAKKAGSVSPAKKAGSASPAKKEVKEEVEASAEPATQDVKEDVKEAEPATSGRRSSRRAK